MSRQAFHLLLERYLSGKCTPEEQELVKQWYDLLDHDQTVDLTEANLDEVETCLWNKINKKTTRKKKHKNTIFHGLKPYSIAATLLLPLLGIGFWINWKLNQVPAFPQFINTNINRQSVSLRNTEKERKTVCLPDGSHITLFPGATIQYPVSFSAGRREVILTGDALFSVKADPSNPFWVFHKGLITKVLGTQFLIKSNPRSKEDEVIVYRGKVEVIRNDKDEHLFKRLLSIPEIACLSINQRAILSQKDNELREALVEHPIPVATPANSSNLNIFHEVKLVNLAKQLTALYSIEIKVEDALQAVTFTGDLSNMELYKQLDFICSVTQSSYQIEGKTINIQ